MIIKVTGHSSSAAVPWWYEKHIGETFNAEMDEEHQGYFYTMRISCGRMLKHHIKFEDCEVIS